MQTDYGQEYARLYNEHWWWRARERILMRVLRQLPLPKPARVLDVGCGDGLFFKRLRELGTVEGIEADRSLVRPDNPDRQRIHHEPLGHPSYPTQSFDLITACDVIEHIEDDRAAVLNMLAMLAPGGFLLITVPAFMALWDEHDDVNQHFRRYTVRSLRAVLPAQAELHDIRYLFNGLFLPKLLVGLRNRTSRRKVKQSALPPAPVNAVMARLCEWESLALGPFPIPFGTSVLAVLRKPP